MSRTGLALTMIVRNEARCLARCLQSAQTLVDEIIICDTGSTDESVDIAKKFGACVVHLPWPGHFAQARNHCLDHSRADWNLVLDADEWVDSAVDPQVLRQFVEDGPQRVGLVRVRSTFMIHQRSECADSWLPRLLPRGVRFVGQIHEQPAHRLPHGRTGVLLHHDGYEPERAHAKASRNFELLKATLSRHPDDPTLHYQMGVQYDAASDWQQACESYQRALSYGAAAYPFSHSLGVRLLHALSRTQQYSEALAWAKYLEERWPRSSDVFFAIGNLCLDLASAEPRCALDSWLPSAEAAWQRCLEIGEDHAEQDEHVVGRGSFLAAHNLRVVHEAISGLSHKMAQ
jgi:hypothetical protein